MKHVVLGATTDNRLVAGRSPLNPDTPPKMRALCLFSGGLDSQLAVCVLREQGVGVEGVLFESPFFLVRPAQRAAEQLGLRLHRVEFTDDILSLLQHPPHGFGTGMNPCIDCHARMLQRAGALMQELGLHFLITGEVLDERPMSQHRGALAKVAAVSGYADLVLRPLSAKLLPPTLPEQKGWVDRERLLDLRGRSRHRQIELAWHFGLREIPQPAGGCRLTEPHFARRLRDLRDHEGLSRERWGEIERLRIGRHFRLPSGRKLIVGRNQSDNQALIQSAAAHDFYLRVLDVAGPVGVIAGGGEAEDLRIAAAICVRYSDAPRGTVVRVRVSREGREEIVVASAAPEDELARWRVG